MYSTNITKDVAPAMADPSAKMAAIKTNASIFEGLAGIGEEVSKGYTLGKMEAIKDESTALQQEFLVKNQAQAEQQRLTTAYGEMQQSVQNIQEDGFGTPQQLQVAQENLNILDERLARLKEAAQGGMSNEQYITRINTLESKWTTQYPGLTDKIREIVGKNTGIVGGSLWAQEAYVKERFSPQQGYKALSPQEIRDKDIEAMAASDFGLGNRESLHTLSRTNPNAYQAKVTAFNDLRQMKSTNTAIVASLNATQGETDAKAGEASVKIVRLFSGMLGMHVAQTHAASTESYLTKVIALDASGIATEGNAAARKVFVDMHVASMKAGITASKNAAETQLDNYFANNNVSDSKKASMRGDLDRAETNYLKNYANDTGMVAMASIMSANADKSMAHKAQLVDLYIKQYNSGFVRVDIDAFNAGGAAKDSLKLRRPDVYAGLEKLRTELDDTLTGMSSDLSRPNLLSVVSNAVIAAREKPTSSILPKDTPKADVRTTLAVVGAKAREALAKSELGPGDASLISCSFANNVEKGCDSQLLASNYGKLKDKVKKLSESDQGIIKAASSTASVSSVTSMQALRTGIDGKYGVNLNIGVFQDGTIGVVPMPITTGLKGTKAVADIDRRDNYELAATEFMKNASPILNNLVHTRAMLTDESKVSIGQDFSRILNSNAAYKGFYRSVPVAAPAVAAETPATETGTPVAEVTSTPDVYAAKIRQAETSGDNKAKNSKTTATGPYQFLEETWKDTVAKYNLPYSLEDRTDLKKSTEVFNLFTKDNTKVLTADLGRAPTDVELHAAQVLGATGAVQFLKGKPTDRARTVVSDAAVEKNMEIFFDDKAKRFRTVKEVRAIFAKKMS